MITTNNFFYVSKVNQMSKHTLVIVRHAKAQQGGAPSDQTRQLSNAGLVQAQKLGAELAETLAHVNTVFVSQALRAQQTWEAMAAGAGIDPSSVRVRTDEVIYSGDPEAIWEDVRLGSGGYTSLLIGHEPTISEVANLVLKEGVDNPVADGMPTGSAVILDWGKNWKEWHAHCADLADYVHVSHKE